MGTKDENIIKIIIEYIQEWRYNQAILLDGEWGVGKTFFVKEKLMKEMSTRLTDISIYYISLYGVTSAEQIVDEIYSAMLEKIIEKKFGNDKSKVIEKGIVVTSKLFATGMKYLNIDKDALPKLSDIKDLRNSIIIFDDVERCGIEINQTFGIINNLVEHNSIKVILVMNQKEIERMDIFDDIPNKLQILLDDRILLNETSVNSKNQRGGYTKEQLIMRAEQLFAEDVFYKRIKEKLVGLTIYYQPNLSDVFLMVVEKFIDGSDIKQYLLSNKQKIVNIFEKGKNYNIRTLIFGLIAFDKFYHIIKEIDFAPHTYIDNEIDKILHYTIYSAIRLKSGKMMYSWDDKASKHGIVYYDSEDWKNSIYGYRFVDDYLRQCILEKEIIVDIISDIVVEQKNEDESKKMEKSLNFPKLETWWKLEDEELENIVSKVVVELKEMKYSPEYFKGIIVTFMQIENSDFAFFEFGEVIKLMEMKLDEYTDGFDCKNLEVLSNSEEFIEKYNSLIDPILKKLRKKENESNKLDTTFLCEQGAWDNNFEVMCKKNRQQFIIENKFFYYISPEKFILQLKEAKTSGIYNFLEGIKVIYNCLNINEFFKPDIPNIKYILEKLNVEQICNGKKTKKMAIENLQLKLCEYLEIIELPIHK